MPSTTGPARWSDGCNCNLSPRPPSISRKRKQIDFPLSTLCRFVLNKGQTSVRMTTLLLATRNAHKIAEIRAILGAEFKYLSLKDFSNAPQVIEDAKTFAGNATKKAVTLANWIAVTRAESRVFVLADDSGLEVDALNGAPGVHSARFAAHDRHETGNSADAENSAKLLKLLHDVPPEKRAARFRCVLALTPTLEQAKKTASPVC